MKYLKRYNESTTSHQEVCDYINDILLDISDLDFPYVQRAFIHREVIMFEICSNDKGVIDDTKFEITEEIISVLKRCIEYTESQEFKIKIRLCFGESADTNRAIYNSYMLKKHNISNFVGRSVAFIGVTITD